MTGRRAEERERQTHNFVPSGLQSVEKLASDAAYVLIHSHCPVPDMTPAVIAAARPA